MNCPLIGECIGCNFFVCFVLDCVVFCVSVYFSKCAVSVVLTLPHFSRMSVVCLTAELIILVCIFTAINRNYDAGCVLFKVINRYISETIKRFLNCKYPVCLRVYFIIIIIIRSNGNGAY